MRKLALVVTVSLAGLGIVACGADGNGGGSVFTTIDETHPITAGAPMNPFNAMGNSFDGYDQMELGYTQNSSTDPNADYPGLAASWTPVAGGLVVHIQPRAGWSDGRPVDAADVRTSAALAFVAGTQPTNLAGVRVMGPKEIEFLSRPGTTNQLFVSEVLQTIVVPSFEYDPEMPADIWSVITASEGSGTAATAAKSTLSTIARKVDVFAPSKDISAGPFTIVRLNTGEGLLARNPYFFDAARITPKDVVIRNYTGNQQIWNYLEAGELDAAPYSSMPESVLKQILARAGNEEKSSPSFTGAALAFDEADYPYGITAVRQALAYLLDRPAITRVGEAVSGTPAATESGLIDSVVPDWLTPAQQKALDPYRYDPAKATSLLDGAGFTKRGGHWYLPDGKPWKITIEAVSGFSDWIAASTYMASRLTSYGIPSTDSIASDYATYLADIAAGDYPIGFWLNALGPSVSAAYSRVWGANVTAVGNTAEQPSHGSFLHTPSTYTLPGYGRVDPDTLTEKLADLPPAAAKPVVAELAAAYDAEVPMITLWDYTLVQFVNTTRFTDFPTQDGLLAGPPGLWMWNGYVHAR